MKKNIGLNLLLSVGIVAVAAAQKPMKTIERPTARIENPSAPTRAERGVPTIVKPFANSSGNAVRTLTNFQKPTASILPEGLKITAYTEGGLPTWISGKLPSNIVRPKTVEARAEQYLAAINRAMQIDKPWDEFRISKIETDDIGQTHVRLQQTFGGLTVWNGNVILHEQNGDVQLMNGRYFPTPKVKTLTPTVATATAEATVMSDLQKTFGSVSKLSDAVLPYVGGQQIRSELLIFHKNDDAKAERLTWHVTAYRNMVHRYEYFVDAENGQVLDSYSSSCDIAGEQTYEVSKNLIGLSAQNTEGSDFSYLTKLPTADGATTANGTDLLGVTRTINTYQIGSKYYLLDASRPMYNAARSTLPSDPIGGIQTLDNQNTDDGPVNYVTTTNNAWAAKSISAHYNGGVAYLYYKNVHNRNSINGKGGTITDFINVTDGGSQMDNAYWNGEAMYYGNGAGVFYPLAQGLDVAGHEMTHGVIQNEANLNYQGESGALNESFADVFGVLIDRNNWTIGEDVIKNRSTFTTGFLRDLSNPHNGGSSLSSPGWQPATVSEKYGGSQDNGGVHINSGIPNYAFYLFASNAAVGKDAAEKIYYRTLSNYLVASAKFIDCRAAVEQSVKDLFAGNTAMLTAAQNAFTTVGIGTGGSSTGTTYQQDLPVNPGTDYVVYASNDKTKLLLASPNNTSTPVTLSSRGIKSKPSVSDDGTEIVYIGKDKKMYDVFIDWTAGTFSDQVIQTDAIWNNVAISKDGNLIAGNTGDSLLYIYYYGGATVLSKTYKLYNPTFTQGVDAGVVRQSDALEFDPYGENVVYDALTQISNSSGGTIEYWDVAFIAAWSNTQRAFGTGQVQKLFSNLPNNTNIGNPSYAKNSPYIVAFDYIDDSGTTSDYYVLAANTQTGVATQAATGIFHNNTLGYPSYSRTDNRLLITNLVNASNSQLVTVNLASGKIEPNSTATTTIKTDAQTGAWFANGKRVISGTADELDKTAVQISPNPFDNQLVVDISADATTDGKVEIFDLLGKLTLTKPLSISSGANRFSIETSALSAGAYLLKVTVGGKSRASLTIKN